MAGVEIGEATERYDYDTKAYLPLVANAKLIAEVDESESYETDQTRIYAEDSGTFVLAGASGCSCWDGEWGLVRYDTLEELLTDIGPKGTDGDRMYHPTFAGVKDLTEQVNEWLRANRMAGMKFDDV